MRRRKRAAALLLSFYGPLKESKNSDAVVNERYSIVLSLLASCVIFRRAQHSKKKSSCVIYFCRSEVQWCDRDSDSRY